MDTEKPLHSTEELLAESHKMVQAAMAIRRSSDRNEIALRFAVALATILAPKSLVPFGNENPECVTLYDSDGCASYAFQYADAFIAARDAKP